MPVKVLRIDLGDIAMMAIDQARDSSERVIELVQGDLRPGETITDRLKLVAKEALSLAHTFQSLDTVMRAVADGLPSDDDTEARPGPAQGCATAEGDPSVN